MESPNNNIETNPERVFTKEAVIELVDSLAAQTHAEKPQILRELSDENGLYLLELRIETKIHGYTLEFEYMRKGRYGRNQASATALHLMLYVDGVPQTGDRIAEYNAEADIWVYENPPGSQFWENIKEKYL